MQVQRQAKVKSVPLAKGGIGSNFKKLMFQDDSKEVNENLRQH